MAKTIKGIKAGTTTITASYGSLSSTVSLTVAQLDVKNATIGALSNQTYTGSAFKLKPTVTMTVGGVSTALAENTDYTLSWNSNSDGTACVAVGTITVTVTGRGNYKGTNTTRTYQITNASFTVSEPDQSYVYNGSSQGVAISVSGLKGGQTATIKYGTASGTYNLPSAPQITNVLDSKTIYWQVTAPNHTTQTGSYTLTITKATPGVPVLTKGTGNYNGSTTYYAKAANASKCVTPNTLAQPAGKIYYGTSKGSTSYSITAGTAANLTSMGRKDVGTTTIYAFFRPTDTDNYNDSAQTASTTVVVSNGTLTVTATPYSGVYDGAAHAGITSISAKNQSGAPVTPKYTYSTSESGTYNSTIPTVQNVTSGTTIYWKAALTGYNDVSGSVVAKVTNASFTVTEPDQSYVYNGSAQGKAITVSDLKGGQTATIKYGTTEGTYNLTSAPQITNVAESKTIYWQVTAPNHTTKTGSYTLTITEKAISIPNPTGITKTYDGKTYYATFPTTTGASITKYQTSTDGSTWNDASPATTNPGRSLAGTIYVRAYYTASTNYKGSGYSSSAAITINKATITVSAPDQTYTYNGSKQGVAITATTVNSQTATIKYGTTSGTYDLTSAPQITNVVDSKTIYYQVTAPNHTTKTGSYKLTITKATPTFALTGDTKVFHNTAYIKATASVAGTVHWGTSTSSMNSTTPVSAGTATNVTSRGDSDGVGTTTIYAYFTPTDASNYNSVGNSSSYARSAAAKITASTDNNISVSISSTLAYNGASQVIATKTGGEGCASFTLGYSTTSGGTVTWGTENATTLSVAGPGTYYIHYKVTPDSNHSTTITDKQLDGTAVIGQGTLTITIIGYSGTYDGNSHNIVKTGPSVKNQEGTAVTGVTYTYSTSESGTYSASLTRTNATGTASNENATVTYWVKAEKSGYTTAKKSFTVYIARAVNPLTISPTSKTIYNTSGYNTFTITPSGAQGDVSYSSSDTGKATVNSTGLVTYAAAGTATITVTAAGNTNYKSGSKTCTVTTKVDTISSYGNVTGTIVITQKANFPAGGVTLTTSNISTYFSYSTPCAQTITWESGNTTQGKINYDWSGDNVTIPSLGKRETSATTSVGIKFTVTARGEGGKTASKSVTSGNQEANPVTSIVLKVGGSSGTKTINFGDSATTEVTATYKSGSTGVITPTSITSSDTTVATVS